MEHVYKTFQDLELGKRYTVFAKKYTGSDLTVYFRAARYLGNFESNSSKIRFELSDVTDTYPQVTVAVERESISTVVDDIRNNGNLIGVVDLLLPATISMV